MKAVGKYIVISPKKEVSVKTKAGLILGEDQREDVRYREADVVAVGSDVKGLKKDNKIYYDKAAGFNIEIKGKLWKVIKEHDVVIIL